MFVSVLKLLHSQLLHPTGTPFPFIFIFGAISSISAIVLGISIAVAMQKRQLLFPSCCAMFQAPFVAAIIYGMYLAFQGPLAGNVIIMIMSICTVDFLVTHTPYNPYSLIPHTFSHFPSWFAGISTPYPILHSYLEAYNPYVAAGIFLNKDFYDVIGVFLNGNNNPTRRHFEPSLHPSQLCICRGRTSKILCASEAGLRSYNDEVLTCWVVEVS